MKQSVYKKIGTVGLATLLALGIVWVILITFDWGQEYLATKQSPAYEALPFEFKLKAAPEDVIFSEAFTTVDGADIVRYAYTAFEVGPQLNEDITRRTPESYTEVINTFKDENGKPMETLKTTFFSKPQFYEVDGTWKQIEYATTTPEIFAMSGAIQHIKRRELVEWLLPGAPVFAQTSTFYPDPDVEIQSVDGVIGSTATDLLTTLDDVLASAIAGANPYADDSISSISILTWNDADGGDFFAEVAYGAFLFNTAALGTTATVQSGTVSVFVEFRYQDDNDGNDLIRLVDLNTTSNTSLTAGDFDDFIFTNQSTVTADITSITDSAYLNFTLNTSGINNINTTGVTKFGMYEGHTAGLCDNCYSGITVSAAETAGTSQDPKLEVTYTGGATSFGFWFPF